MCGGSACAQCQSQLDDARRTQHLLLTSISWRLTAPLRSLKALLRVLAPNSIVRNMAHLCRRLAEYPRRVYGVIKTAREGYAPLASFPFPDLPPDMQQHPHNATPHAPLTLALEPLDLRPVPDLSGVSPLHNAPYITDSADIDIIIPVYNGREHLEKLLPSLLAHTDGPHRFVFIDDASDDVTVYPWLEAQLQSRTDALLLRNSKNLGFPATVNRGAMLSHGDFVILNTDTVVPAGWLSRLMAALYRHSRTGSATPFSNAATIFSFPVPNNDDLNTAFLNFVGLEAINAALRDNAALARTAPGAPTGVGFCMVIARRAWEEAGGFDAQRFGNGYGEENDWCQRTRALGWRHVLAPDVYVTHVHGGSFAPDIKAMRCAAAADTLRTLHPHYDALVRDHCAVNPWTFLRHAAMLRLLTLHSRNTLYYAHTWGGGAEAYMQRDMSRRTESGETVLVLRCERVTGVYTLEVVTRRIHLTTILEHPEALCQPHYHHLLALREVVVNHLAGWPMEPHHNVLRHIRQVARCHDARLRFLFHDYYSLCPKINLLTPEGQYCGCPRDTRHCATCERAWGEHISAWRRQWQEFFDACHEVVFFSDVSRRLCRSVLRIPRRVERMKPHAPLWRYDVPWTPRSNISKTVVVVGIMVQHKGGLVVQRVAALLRKRAPHVHLVIVGQYFGAPASNIHVTGPYAGQRLPEILNHYNAAVALFPSIWPETYSFVVQELMHFGIPLVCFDLGAPAERVRAYSLGRLVPLNDVDALVDSLLEFVPPPTPL